MGINQVVLCGIINSTIIEDSDCEDNVFNPIRFSIQVDNTVVYCVASDVLAVHIQRRCMRGSRVLIKGCIISREIRGAVRNFVQCITVYTEGDQGFVEEIKSSGNN